MANYKVGETLDTNASDRRKNKTSMKPPMAFPIIHHNEIHDKMVANLSMEVFTGGR